MSGHKLNRSMDKPLTPEQEKEVTEYIRNGMESNPNEEIEDVRTYFEKKFNTTITTTYIITKITEIILEKEQS